MVRAGSISTRNKSQRNKRLIGVAVVFFIVILVVAFSGSLFSDEDRPKLATESKLSAKLITQIKDLNYVNQPEKIPVGYKRTDVKIIAASKSGTGCEEVLQRFLKTESVKSEFIDVYSYIPSCEFARPLDAEGFSIGSYTGWSSDSNKNESILLEIGVNGNKVRVESDILLKQLTPVLESFVAFSQTSPKDTINITKSK